MLFCHEAIAFQIDVWWESFQKTVVRWIFDCFCYTFSTKGWVSSPFLVVGKARQKALPCSPSQVGVCPMKLWDAMYVSLNSLQYTSLKMVITCYNIIYFSKESICRYNNVGKAIINHPFSMVYTTHLWWLGGWFIIAIPTLGIITINIQKPNSSELPFDAARPNPSLGPGSKC